MQRLKIFLPLSIFLNFSFSLDFQSIYWNNGNSCLTSFKNGYAYSYNPRRKSLFIYKIVNDYPSICLKTQKNSKLLQFKIVFDTKVNIEIFRCGYLVIVRDKELGFTQVFNLKKVIKVGEYKTQNLKIATLEPKTTKPGTYYWYGINFFVVTKKEKKQKLTPLEVSFGF